MELCYDALYNSEKKKKSEKCQRTPLDWHGAHRREQTLWEGHGHPAWIGIIERDTLVLNVLLGKAQTIIPR